MHAIILDELLRRAPRHVLEHAERHFCREAECAAHGDLAGRAVAERCAGTVQVVEREFVADAAAGAAAEEVGHLGILTVDFDIEGEL